MDLKKKAISEAMDHIFHEAVDHGNPKALEMVKKILDDVFVNAPPEMREYLDQIFEKNDIEEIKKAFKEDD